MTFNKDQENPSQKNNDQEDYVAQGQAAFSRPLLPRESRRLPTRWLHKSLPQYNVVEKNKKQDFQTSEDEANNIYFSTVEDTSAQVHRWKQEEMIQRKVSFVLREFYKRTSEDVSKVKGGHLSLGSKLAQYNKEIAFANKSLLVAGKYISNIESLNVIVFYDRLETIAD